MISSRFAIPRWLVAGLMTIWWIATPAVDAAYYSTQARRGAYPPEADSIGIPIGQSVAGWLLLTPVILLLVFLALRRAPGRVELLGFDRSTFAGRIWSAVWTVLLLAFAGSEAWFAVRSLQDAMWLDVAHSVLGVCVALALRAAFAAPRTRSESISSSRAA